MIIPQPESDLSMGILVLGAEIISAIRSSKNQQMIIEDLLKQFMLSDIRRSPVLFFNTLTFLYAIGIIKEENYKVRIINGYTQKTLFCY